MTTRFTIAAMISLLFWPTLAQAQPAVRIERCLSQGELGDGSYARKIDVMKDFLLTLSPVDGAPSAVLIEMSLTSTDVSFFSKTFSAPDGEALCLVVGDSLVAAGCASVVRPAISLLRGAGGGRGTAGRRPSSGSHQ